MTVMSLSAPGCAAAPPQSERASPAQDAYDVPRLLAEGDQVLGKPIRIEGVLENAGSNYFTDRQIVLRAKDGARVPVQPWLPLTAAPGGGSGGQPVLTNYLGKSVRLEAVLEEAPMKGLGVVRRLRVISAEALSQARPRDPPRR